MNNQNEQPLDPNVASVIDQLRSRAAVGLKKYGATTADAGLSLIDWLRHAQQEALDMAVYLEAAINTPNLNQDKWRPDECPITGLPFFTWITTLEGVEVPTYGGPFDSYTIPQMERKKGIPWHKQELYSDHYDHDFGGWVDTGDISLRIIDEDDLHNLKEKGEVNQELLEALKELRDWYAEWTGLPACAANAAIEKAEGREG